MTIVIIITIIMIIILAMNPVIIIINIMMIIIIVILSIIITIVSLIIMIIIDSVYGLLKLAMLGVEFEPGFRLLVFGSQISFCGFRLRVPIYRISASSMLLNATLC